jgi:hypothetical protein
MDNAHGYGYTHPININSVYTEIFGGDSDLSSISSSSLESDIKQDILHETTETPKNIKRNHRHLKNAEGENIGIGNHADSIKHNQESSKTRINVEKYGGNRRIFTNSSPNSIPDETNISCSNIDANIPFISSNSDDIALNDFINFHAEYLLKAREGASLNVKIHNQHIEARPYYTKNANKIDTVFLILAHNGLTQEKYWADFLRAGNFGACIYVDYFYADKVFQDNLSLRDFLVTSRVECVYGDVLPSVLLLFAAALERYPSLKHAFIVPGNSNQKLNA